MEIRTNKKKKVFGKMQKWSQKRYGLYSVVHLYENTNENKCLPNCKSGLKRWMVSSDSWFVNMEIRTKENNVSKLQQWPQKPWYVLGDPFK